MNEEAQKSDPQLMAHLLSMGRRYSSSRIWRDDELGAILKHQMNAVVQFDLASLETGQGRRLQALSAAEGLLLQSFTDLFLHPHPPIELLLLAKQFAKANVGQPNSALPDEVARLLYFLSIAVAMVRCNQRITELDDATLRTGLEWAMGQRWVDETTRSILGNCLEQLRSGLGEAV